MQLTSSQNIKQSEYLENGGCYYIKNTKIRFITVEFFNSKSNFFELDLLQIFYYFITYAYVVQTRVITIYDTEWSYQHQTLLVYYQHK